MTLVWLGFIFELLILILLKPMVNNFETVSIIAVLIHTIWTSVIFLMKKNNKFIFLGAFFSRLAFMFFDLYANHIFVLPSSGGDTEAFYRQAIFFSDRINRQSYDGEIYSKIMGFLFSLIGPQRVLGQYINVLFGLSVVYIIYKILNMLDISKEIHKIIMLIAVFFPNSLIMSAIFLREIFPTFFVSLSLYYFIKWVKTSGNKNIIFSLVLLGLASIFHSGVVGIALGYSFTFLFYKRKYNVFKFSTNTVVSFMIIIIMYSIVFTFFGSIIFTKFQSLNGIEDIYQRASSSGEGGSGYLKSFSINNPLQLLVYVPVRSFYFIGSPLPMYWRGFMDIFTFISDSLLYLGTLIYFLKNKNKLGERKIIAISILIMIIGSAFIFGIGVGNAGTAVRHRQKLVPLFLILLGVMIDSKRSCSKINHSVKSNYLSSLSTK